MPVKIRLARHGRKRKPFYYIVVADSRAPRDGRYIERIGSYVPTTNPATVDLDFDKALSWLQNGAQPTDTARSILSYKGVMYKNHLLKGVAKGALTEDEAQAKFDSWLTDKEQKIQAKKERLSKDEELKFQKKLELEVEINKKRADELATIKSDAEAKIREAAKKEEEENTEESTDEVVEVIEEKTEVVTEEKAEAKEEKKENE